jgi:hypothetical protein
MKKLLSALFALALCSTAAFATVPWAANCVISPCDALNGVVSCPDTPAPIPASIVTLTIRNQANNPIVGAAVNLTLGAGPLCICNTMVFNTTTIGGGIATMTMRFGGCIMGVADAAVFRANGVLIRSYMNTKSPDWDGAAGSCQVNLPDLVRFVPRTDLCFDFDNNGAVDLGDIVIFTSGFTPAHACTPL